VRFDLVDLQLLMNVADAHSITRGAERANLTLSSASARIRGMEQALGVLLLVRNRSGVSLTPAGQCLLEHARLVLQQVERMRGELGAHARGLAGSVRLLSNTAAISEHLPKVISPYLARNPTISIDLEECESVDIAQAIASGAGDIGIASDAALSDAVERFPFRLDRLQLVVPRGDVLATRRRCGLEDVVDRDFVGLPRERALQRHLAGHAARLGATLKVRVRVNGFDAMCHMVETGVGIAVVPEAAAKRCRNSMRIELVTLDEDWAVRQLSICVRRRKVLSVGAQKLVEHLRKAGDARG
jgi:DNA-binding transcriptional LysR family regulator